MQDVCQLQWQRGFEFYDFVCFRVSEGEFLCVQKVAVQVSDLRSQTWILDRVVSPSSVSFISDHRMLQPCEMNANLMRSSGIQLNIEQCETVEGLSHSIKG